MFWFLPSETNYHDLRLYDGLGTLISTGDHGRGPTYGGPLRLANAARFNMAGFSKSFNGVLVLSSRAISLKQSGDKKCGVMHMNL